MDSRERFEFRFGFRFGLDSDSDSSRNLLQPAATCYSLLQSAATCCNLLQLAAICGRLRSTCFLHPFTCSLVPCPLSIGIFFSLVSSTLLFPPPCSHIFYELRRLLLNFSASSPHADVHPTARSIRTFSTISPSRRNFPERPALPVYFSIPFPVNFFPRALPRTRRLFLLFFSPSASARLPHPSARPVLRRSASTPRPLFLPPSVHFPDLYKSAPQPRLPLLLPLPRAPSPFAHKKKAPARKPSRIDFRFSVPGGRIPRLSELSL